MAENQVAAAGRGYVRAVFSRRWRGFAVPLDLVRAHLRSMDLCDCAALVSGVQDGELRALEMRARVREAFAGYLVSDEAGGAFVEARKRHQVRNDRIAMTGYGPWSFDLSSGGVDSGHGCMDAPGYIAAGSMRSYRSEQSGDLVIAQSIRGRA